MCLDLSTHPQYQQVSKIQSLVIYVVVKTATQICLGCHLVKTHYFSKQTYILPTNPISVQHISSNTTNGRQTAGRIAQINTAILSVLSALATLTYQNTTTPSMPHFRLELTSTTDNQSVAYRNPVPMANSVPIRHWRQTAS